MYQNDTEKRVLKVEEIGDYWAEKTRPMIRLKGKWLENMGIFPNNRVVISSPENGTLIVKVLEGADRR